MKRKLEKVAPEDYSHYLEQLRMQLAMFENLAPNGSLADKKRALDHIQSATVHVAHVACAFSRLLRAYAESYRVDPPGTAGRVGGVGDSNFPEWKDGHGGGGGGQIIEHERPGGGHIIGPSDMKF